MDEVVSVPVLPSLRGFVNEHLALFISLAGALLVALRILAVSGFEVTTMLVVLRSQGTGSVIAGTILPSLFVVPVLAGGVCTALAAFARANGVPDRSKQYLRFALALFIVGP